jgi:hypothetical protein
MKNSSVKLLIVLGLCVMVTGLLVAFLPVAPQNSFSDWEEMDNYLMRQIHDFGYKSNRVQSRSVQVHESFSRKVITVDIPPGFPQTVFHKQLADSLRQYGVRTYAVVHLPDPNLEIHVIVDDTVVRSIFLRKVSL